VRLRFWGARVAVAVVAALLIVVASVGLGAVLGDGPDRAVAPEPIPEYDPARVVSTPQPADGEILPEGERGGTVVVDTGHGNEVSRASVAPLAEALTRVGYRVEFTGTSLSESLDGANALLVVDPGTEFSAEEVEAVREFTRRGGRLVVMAEPNQKVVQTGLLTTQITTEESAVTTLASAYGMSVDANYLYNLRRNGGNYRYLRARPGENAEVDGVSNVTLYTPVAVRAERGTTVLRAAAGTYRAGGDAEPGRPAVAVRRNNVLLVGDSTILRETRYNVGDNEAFLTYVAEFMIGGEATATGGAAEENGDEETNGGDAAATPDGTAAGTGTAVDTAAETPAGTVTGSETQTATQTEVGIGG
jgi:hypothetical protein